MENIKVGQGVSENEDPYKAGKKAAEKAVEDFTGEDPDIGFVFCSGTKYGKDDETVSSFVEGVKEELSGITWIGCTSAGEISREGFTKDSAVVTLIESDMIYWGVEIEEIDDENPVETGEKVAKGALESLDIDKMVHSYSQYQFLKEADTSEMVTSDPYNMIVIGQGPTVGDMKYGVLSDMVQGIKKVIKSNPVVGGYSANRKNLLRSYQFYNGEFYKDRVVAASFVTTLKTDFRMSHGFKPTENVVLATGVEGNIVGELNSMPAFEEYSHMIQVEKRDLFPKKIELAKKLNLDSKILEYLAKSGKNIFDANPFLKSASMNPLGFKDENNNIWVKLPADIRGKKIEFFNKVPNNSALTLLEADTENIYQASLDTINNLKTKIDDAGIIFSFECAVRNFMFEEEVEKASEEYRSEDDVVPIGFATGGEIGTAESGNSGGQTLTLTTLGVSDNVFSEK